MLYLPEDIYNEIISHSKETYPYEACGVLVGKQGSGTTKEVLKVYRVENINKERTRDRYEIDPKDLLRIEKEVSSLGLEVLGFYHSHPDHPDRPSNFDMERAWPLYSYLIVSVFNGSDTTVRSWTFEEEGKPFREEGINTVVSGQEDSGQ